MSSFARSVPSRARVCCGKLICCLLFLTRRQDRKYFDSGDYNMEKAGKSKEGTGSAHPTPELIHQHMQHKVVRPQPPGAPGAPGAAAAGAPSAVPPSESAPAAAAADEAPPAEAQAT